MHTFQSDAREAGITGPGFEDHLDADEKGEVK
jgi:hypothetical protein